ncbi:Hsp70 family protein [Neobacillus sp. NPDC093127]|uniref:Hsp70 family protein n=1 Tax=Neobacillus sp. NPDC093127 TaxID=3364296 RepID=UPI00382A41D1
MNVMKGFSRYVGIDLGTTNSTVSVSYKNPKGEVYAKTLQVKQYDEQGINITFDEVLPSVVYFDEHSTPNAGRFAKKMLSIDPKQTMSKVKRHIGKEVEWETANKEKYSPEEISAFILRTLKGTAEDHFLGQEIDSAVITVPANFNFQQQAKTKIAAELAGFDKEKIHMIPEPTAALIDFLNEERQKDPSTRSLDITQKPQTILVFDLGGGTCDVTINRVGSTPDGGLDIKDLSISQYTELGGADFDDAVMKYMFTSLLKTKGIPAKQLAQKYTQNQVRQIRETLSDAAEQAKKYFSRSINTRILMGGMNLYENQHAFDDITFSMMLLGVPEEFQTTISISKKEYDEVIKGLLYESQGSRGKNIEYPIMNAIRSAVVPLKIEDIDQVFLVGGMTEFPTIKGRIYELFGKAPISAVNPMQAVSRGAAIYHYYQGEIQLGKAEAERAPFGQGARIYPQNIFINVLKGTPVTLLPKNAPLPYDKTFDKGFFVTGHSEFVNDMELELFTAEDPEAILQQQLKSARLEFEQPVRVGTQIVIHVSVDYERNVTVKAWLKEDETQMIHVNLGVREYTAEEKARILRKQEAMKMEEVKTW